MSNLNTNAKDKALKSYYKEIKEQYDIYFKSHTKGNPPESAVEPAFLTLLLHCSKKVNWKFVPKKPLPNGNIPDGTFLEPSAGILSMGYIESKDDDDDLDAEIQTKLGTKNYPRFNILFWQPKRVVLYQKTKVRDENIAENPEMLASVLNDFFSYEHFDSRSWNEAIKTFDEQMPILAKGLLEKIEESEKSHKPFIKEFDKFYNLCKSSINPNIGRPAIKEMIVQHLLTERILRSIFDLDRFVTENAVAGQLDKLIESMTSKYFNRKKFLGTLDHFYDAIIKAAEGLEDFKTKQVFLNDIFERFFQGWAVKSADRLGIVYTPQSVVDFMVKSVDEILKTEFGKKHGLGSKNVHIIDPFVGTGNFIVNVIDKISPTKLAHKYEHELHCNEISLMPYYIANMNIEHAYFEAVGQRKEFPGICFADTFQMSEEHGGLFFNEENTQRVIKQAGSEIFVVISNPPYNAHQADEMDNNKNRKYPVLENKIKETYSKDSKATLKNALSDPYVKAIKWASDRIGEEGVVAMITNNSFVDTYAFDGMRKHLEKDFDRIYVLDLGGNVRKNPKLSGTTHNVFGIQVGVSINIFIKKKTLPDSLGEPPLPPLKGGAELKGEGNSPPPRGGKGSEASQGGLLDLYYARVDEFWKKEQKYDYLEKKVDIGGVEWRKLTPNKNHMWLTDGIADDFEEYPLMGDKNQKGKADCDTIFSLFSSGVKTNRDVWAFNFDKKLLEEKMKLLINTYNVELKAWQISNKKQKIDDFVTYDDKIIKWDGTLKNDLLKGNKGEFSINKIRSSTYRPFIKKYLYYSSMFNNSTYLQYKFFPTPESEKENLTVLMTDVGSEKPFMCLISDRIIDLHTVGAGCSAQCFPFYTYNEDGTGRRENITDKTLTMYQEHYKKISPPPIEENPSTPLSLPKGEGQGVRVKLINLARTLRKKQTPSEEIMWGILRDKRFAGLKFRRQHPLHGYILDFYCHEKKLAIEIDGGGHNTEEKQKKDKHRDEVLLGKGIKTLRFWSNDVTGNIEGVVDKIYDIISPPQPSPQRGEGAASSSPLPTDGRGVRGEGSNITKWDIFYYIYAMLHHPKYREDFKENLKRSLPRIPFAPDFHSFSKTGKKLADLHLNYESAEIYELDEIIDKDIFPEAKFTVDKMKLSKDKTELIYNKAITLSGIPPEVYDYKLGNRSALEWIVDQYRVKTDKRSGITQDPNNFDGDERYIFDLVGKIVTVSLETVKLVKELSKLKYK